jgi:[ribosomal protein S5]-alanine N-acetyltransferase
MELYTEHAKDRPVLQTKRLTLPRPDAGDVGSIIAIAGDWEVARRLARVPHPYGETDALFFLDKVVPNEWVWAITLRGSSELVGMVGLTPDQSQDTAELGYYVDRGHWGLGIATEAARSVVEYGIHNLRLRRITSGYFLDNPSSGRVLSKLGFVQTGHAERPCLATGASAQSIEMHLQVLMLRIS